MDGTEKLMNYLRIVLNLHLFGKIKFSFFTLTGLPPLKTESFLTKIC